MLYVDNLLQKGYNETAQEEYYRTLQETRMLQQQYQENNAQFAENLDV